MDSRKKSIQANKKLNYSDSRKVFLKNCEKIDCENVYNLNFSVIMFLEVRTCRTFTVLDFHLFFVSKPNIFLRRVYKMKKKKVRYFDTYRRPDSNKISGYINANALKWDSKTWRFSTYQTTVKEARAFVADVFKIAKSDPVAFNLKEVVKALRSNDNVPTVYTVEQMINDHVQKRYPNACDSCGHRFPYCKHRIESWRPKE